MVGVTRFELVASSVSDVATIRNKTLINRSSVHFAQMTDHASATSSLPQALRMNAEREMPSFFAAASMAASSKS